MKLMNKLAVALIALFCIGNVSAYTWSFKNMTDKTLVVKLRLQAHPYWYYNIVQPGNEGSFDFKGMLSGYCLDNFEWAEYNPTLTVTNVTQNGGLDIYKPGDTMLGSEFSKIPYQYNNADITYMDGLNIAITNKDDFPKILGVAVMSVGEFMLKSPCQSRDFKIMRDDKGNIVFATPQ